MSSHNGACLWIAVFCVWYISLITSSGLVSMCPCGFCRQSNVLLGVRWIFFVWIVLDLVFSKVRYLVMVVLQLNAVCLVIILWASILAFFPILARFSIHERSSMGLVGVGGMWGLWIDCSAWMSGWLWRSGWGWQHAVLMALRVQMCIFNCCFHFFCVVLGKNPPCALTLLGSGGVGFVIHVCSIHWLRELVISWSLFCAVFH